MKKKLLVLVPILLVMVVGLGVFATAPAKSFVMDVNPSIEVTTSRLERVLNVEAKNEDAKALLEKYKNKSTKLEDVVNELVDLMVIHGYIDAGLDNMVMISVKDEDSDSRLVQRVNKVISELLENKQIEATIINTTTEEDDDLTGKQRLVNKASSIDKALSQEELYKMSLQEVIRYLEKNDIDKENIYKIIKKSEKLEEDSSERISEEEAKRIALSKVNGKIVEFEKDDEEYEIEIVKDGIKYEIEIDASTGVIKNYERDDD